jgi:hypothetical protein
MNKHEAEVYALMDRYLDKVRELLGPLFDSEARTMVKLSRAELRELRQLESDYTSLLIGRGEEEHERGVTRRKAAAKN